MMGSMLKTTLHSKLYRNLMIRSTKPTKLIFKSRIITTLLSSTDNHQRVYWMPLRMMAYFIGRGNEKRRSQKTQESSKKPSQVLGALSHTTHLAFINMKHVITKNLAAQISSKLLYGYLLS